MPTELKPCPLCGGEAHLIHDYKEQFDVTLGTNLGSCNSWWVKCTDCQVSQRAYKEAIQAIDFWNERSGE